MPAEDRANRCFSGTVNVAGKADAAQTSTVSRHHASEGLNPECLLAVSDHTVVRQCVGFACSVWRVKAKAEAACWGTFVTTLMWDLCGSVGGSGRELMSVSLGKHN